MIQHYLIVKFLIGGAILVSATVFAKYINPKWGGLILVAPLLTTTSLLFLNHESHASTLQDTVLWAFIFTFPLLLFLGLMYVLLQQYNLYISLGISYCFWFALVLGLQYLRHN